MRRTRIECLSLLILLMASTMGAQLREDSEPIFPSDSRTPNQADAAKLLEAVCPGDVATGKIIECRTGCPDFTDFGRFGDRFSWSLGAVTRGHFLSPTSDDAVLWMEGCEPHSANFGGTVLLTRRSQRWSMLWYKAGVQTAQCHKVSLRDAREILVCIGSAGGQGNSATSLYSEDLLDPKSTLMAGEADDGTFFTAFDSTLACGWNEDNKNAPFPLVRTHIDKVEFSKGKGNGASRVSVTASFGRREMEQEAVKACLEKKDGILPDTKSYRMDFISSGQGYQPTPSSAETATIFKAR
jgi:hypothetical protein